MRKIGRNTPCPCGSGAKYKRCCLNKPNEAFGDPLVLPNVYQLITLKYFSEGYIDLDLELANSEKHIFDSLKDLNKDTNQILKEYLVICEECIKDIASNYTTYEMLFWSRRIGPKNIFNASELSVKLYRDIQTLCIYKYGLEDENIILDENSTVIPKSMEVFDKLEYLESVEKIKNERLPNDISDALTAVLRVEILSFIFLKMTQLYRIYNKTGEINIDKANKSISSSTTEEQSYLIDLYDERLSKSNLFSRTGAFVNINKIEIDRPYFCPYFQLNVDHKTKTKIFNPKNDTYKKVFPNGDEEYEAETNYLFGILNLWEIYNFLELFKDEFEDYYSFALKEFIVFLGYLGYKVTSIISESFEGQIHILNRAYTISNFNLEEFGKEIEAIYPTLHRIIFNEESTNDIDPIKILNSFLLESSKKTDIDIWTRGPKRFLYQLSKGKMVIDYYCLTDIISFIVKEITSTDGDVGNRRANSFEEMLVEEIKLVFGINNIWVCRSEIVSGEHRKEIDASFIKEDILFIIEAKAVNVSFGYDKGDEIAVEFRINKMKQALQESNEKVDFILKFKNSINTKVPTYVKYICPIVISSSPEFIWGKTQELFISEENKIPRILTISDLEELNKIDLNIVRNRNWVIKI